MGAAAFTPDPLASDVIVNDKRGRKGTLALSDDYATGGDSLSLAAVGLTELHNIYTDATAGSDAGVSLVLAGTRTVPLIQAFETEATQVAATTDLSARSLDVILVGV